MVPDHLRDAFERGERVSWTEDGRSFVSEKGPDGTIFAVCGSTPEAAAREWNRFAETGRCFGQNDDLVEIEHGSRPSPIMRVTGWGL